MTPLGSALSSSDSFIDYTKIEPLVLDRVVVKAKKLKEARKEEEDVERNAAAE
jgi:restriction endonuclease Mrr